MAFAGIAMMRTGRRRIVFVPLAVDTLRLTAITVTCGKLLARRAPSLDPAESSPVGAEADCGSL